MQREFEVVFLFFFYFICLSQLEWTAKFNPVVAMNCDTKVRMIEQLFVFIRSVDWSADWPSVSAQSDGAWLWLAVFNCQVFSG